MTTRTVLLMLALLLSTLSQRGFQMTDRSPSLTPDFVQPTSSPAVWASPGPENEVRVGDGDRSHRTIRVFPEKGGEVRFGRYSAQHLRD